VHFDSPDVRPNDIDRGFTALVCHGKACGGHHETIVSGLRECVHRHPHGVLVSAGCVLGRLGCHALATSCPRRPAGTLVVVQPCSVDRDPIGPALWIGPVAVAEDVAAVCRWLDAGHLYTIMLPVHLRFRSVIAGFGATN
jgi:hypothetical protein